MTMAAVGLYRTGLLASSISAASEFRHISFDQDLWRENWISYWVIFAVAGTTGLGGGVAFFLGRRWGALAFGVSILALAIVPPCLRALGIFSFAFQNQHLPLEITIATIGLGGVIAWVYFKGPPGSDQ